MEKPNDCNRPSANKSNSKIPQPISSQGFSRSQSLKLKGSQKADKLTSIKSRLSTSGISIHPKLNKYHSLQNIGPSSDLVRDDDLNSERSFGDSSVCSGHAPFAHNGTTFSYRQMRYIHNCTPNGTTSQEYLTPTQRANRTIKRLRQAIADAQSELIEKESEIARLSKELMDLKLEKTMGAFNANESTDTIDRFTEETLLSNYINYGQSTPCQKLQSEEHVRRCDERNEKNFGPSCDINHRKFDDVSSSISENEKFAHDDLACKRLNSEATGGTFTLGLPGKVETHSERFMDVLVEEGNADNNYAERNNNFLIPNNLAISNTGFASIYHATSPSLSDSGHFDDVTGAPYSPSSPYYNREAIKLRSSQDDLREKHNDKVEHLLKIIADSNDKYFDLKPKYDEAELKIKKLQDENDELKRALAKQEELQKTLYLQLYTNKGDKIESSNIRRDSNLGINFLVESTPCVADDRAKDELINELAVTRKELENVKAMYKTLLDTNKPSKPDLNDAEMTLRFLKSAVYYYLTDTANGKDHLAAVESILGYSAEEKRNIEKAQAWK